jgi:hypothetical protein
MIHGDWAHRPESARASPARRGGAKGVRGARPSRTARRARPSRHRRCAAPG